ncbi:MAG: trigger factor [Lachnospiraceae bacterium]|nr:trigger factor [Lachnospiraceae bacterium]
MKKYRQRAISFMLAAVLVMAVLTGCGGSKEAESLDTVDPAKYVTLGEYKGLTIDAVDTTVSDGDVEKNIQSTLSSHGELKEVTGRAAEMGDTVNIDYVGTRDGVAFEGGTGSYDLKLGSGSFIPGFEEGVVGMNVGEERDIPLTFPEDYHSEELAGAEVVFHVTVNSISEESLPELTDEFVQGLNNGMDTVDEYKTYVKNNLTEQNESTAKANMEADLLKIAVENATIADTLPEWLVSQNAAEFRSSTEAFVKQYGMSLSDYFEQMGSDEETFNSQAEQYGTEKAKTDLVVKAIAGKEKLEVTDKDVEDYYTKYASDYNATVEQVKNAVPEDELKTYLLQQKVMDFLYDNAQITATIVD